MLKTDPLAAARRKLDDLGIVGSPKLTPRMIAAAGGRPGIISALECDDSPEAIAFMGVYRSFSDHEREQFSLVEIFMLAGMTARRFAEVLVGALMQQGADASRLMIAAAMPDVSEALIKAATERQPILNRAGDLVGYSNPSLKAIEIYGKISRMLPTPKGSRTVINVGHTDEEDEDEGPAALEQMDDFLLEIHSATQNQLPAPTVKIPKNASDIADYQFSEI